MTDFFNKGDRTKKKHDNTTLAYKIRQKHETDFFNKGDSSRSMERD